MARDLSTTIQSIYDGMYSTCHCHRYYRGENLPLSNSNTKYMVIPIDEDNFEIPLFAMRTFVDTVNSGQDEGLSSIVAMLNTEDKEPNYVTVDRYMRDILEENIKSGRLVRCNVKSGNNEFIYYGVHGAVFDYDFSPIMICSWQVETFLYENESPEGVIDCGIKYKFKRPILRVQPDVYLSKSDSMEKFIVNKMIAACLERSVYPPHGNYLGPKFVELPRGHSEFIKVELDTSPFVVKQTDTPSISTTNQQLLQIAIDHIDEIIQ